MTQIQKEARAYLERVWHQEDRVRQLRYARARALDAETAVTASPTADGVRGGGVHRRGESYSVLSAQVDEELASLELLQAETLSVIARLDDNTHAALLIARYINDLPWADVAEQLHYSPGYVRKLHLAALEKLGLMLLAKDGTK